VRRQARPSRLLSSAAVLSGASMAANALGYVLTVAAARVLELDDFGAFSALLSLVIVGNVAALAVQATVARRIALGSPSGATAALAAAIAVTVVAGLAAPLLRSWLGIESLAAIGAVAVAVGALAVGAVPMGILQGQERFFRLAVLVLLQAALRVASALTGLLLTSSVLGTMVGIATGLTVSAIVSWLWVRPSLSAPAPAAGSEIASASLLLLGFVLLSNADVVLARGLLDPQDSGLYAAGAIVTKVAFWLSQFVPLLAFPRMSTPGRRLRALKGSLLVVGLMGAVYTAMAVVFAPYVVTLVAGTRYLDVASDLGWFALLGSLLALAQVVVYSGLARKSRWTTAMLWLALGALVLGAVLTDPGLAGLVRLACAVAAVLAVGAAAHELWSVIWLTTRGAACPTVVTASAGSISREGRPSPHMTSPRT
jgi:O-antigen/teichoic acid export membrane protein